MEQLRSIMTIIDKNQDKIPEGDYLDICDKLKNVYTDIQKDEVEIIKPCRWTEIMEYYTHWKCAVREAMKADQMMKKITIMYEDYLNDKPSEGESLYSICLKYFLKENELLPTEKIELYVKEHMESICQDIYDDHYAKAFQEYKYEADEYWKQMTRCDNFDELLDLLSPVELFMHRELCEPQLETHSRVYRQKPKTVIHDGEHVTKEFKWFSHERIYPELDHEEDTEDHENENSVSDPDPDDNSDSDSDSDEDNELIVEYFDEQG